MARKFFYVCAGLFLLAGAFALGARSVGAQAPGDIAGYSVATGGVYHYVIQSNGDVWARYNPNGGTTSFADPPNYVGNFFGGPTPAKKMSMGQIKRQFDNGGGK